MSNSSIYESPSKLIRHRFSIPSFDKYILNSSVNLNNLTKLIKYCNLDDINCRFNVWRLTLGVISCESSV